jgi:HEAT repeat protein
MLKAVVMRSVDAAVERLSSADPVQRQEARQALAAMGRAVVPRLQPLLKADDEHVRWEAVKVLGEAGGPEAARLLVQALSDASRDVRWAATQGLISAGDDALEPVLHELITRAGLVWVREAGIRVLDAAWHERHAPYLRPVLKALKDRAPIFEVPIAAYEALVALHRTRQQLDSHRAAGA